MLQDGKTALMMASEHGRADVVDVLLKHHAQVNLQNDVSIA